MATTDAADAKLDLSSRNAAKRVDHMNTRLCEPFHWDDTHAYDRGKVMSYDDLESGKDFGRYLDVDGDGIPYRTYPGTHPTRGAFFTRGTTKDRYARYSEAGPDYVDNMNTGSRLWMSSDETSIRRLTKPSTHTPLGIRATSSADRATAGASNVSDLAADTR